MGSACGNKPNATKGQTVTLPRSLFTSTSPSASAASGSGLSSGAKIGIGVGVGLGVVALGVIAGIVWFCMRRRRAQTQSGSYMAPPDIQADGEQSTQQSYTQGPKSSVYSEQTYIPELSAADPKEQPAELGGKSVVAELPGHMGS
jgi:hypothetical protein